MRDYRSSGKRRRDEPVPTTPMPNSGSSSATPLAPNAPNANRSDSEYLPLLNYVRETLGRPVGNIVDISTYVTTNPSFSEDEQRSKFRAMRRLHANMYVLKSTSLSYLKRTLETERIDGYVVVVCPPYSYIEKPQTVYQDTFESNKLHKAQVADPKIWVCYKRETDGAFAGKLTGQLWQNDGPLGTRDHDTAGIDDYIFDRLQTADTSLDSLSRDGQPRHFPDEMKQLALASHYHIFKLVVPGTETSTNLAYQGRLKLEESATGIAQVLWPLPEGGE